MLLLLLLPALAAAARTLRYVQFDPPRVSPGRAEVRLEARQNFSLSCSGSRPLTWVLPGSPTASPRSAMIMPIHPAFSSAGNRNIAADG